MKYLNKHLFTFCLAFAAFGIVTGKKNYKLQT